VFEDCESLTTVTIGNGVTSIGDTAFLFCISLTSVTIPNTVTNIGDSAFLDCRSLSGVTIPGGVTSIGEWAFYNCRSLASVTIPNSVTSIADYALSGCTNLTGVYFLGNAPSLGGTNVLRGATNTTIYYLPGMTGWPTPSWGVPEVLWNPQVQTSGATFGIRTNQFGFTITGSSGLVIVVEACTDPGNPIWLPVSTNTLTGGSAYFSDPQWTSYPGRFYRLRFQ
jgi:hypothetical protein